MMLNSTTILYIVAAVVVVAIFAISLAGARRRDGRRRRAIDPYVEGLRSLVDGDGKKAFSFLQQSVKSGKAPTDAYIRLGRLLREKGDPDKALQIHKSLTVKPDLIPSEKVELFVNIAQDYSKLGNSAQAVNVLEAAVKRLGLKDPAVFKMLSKEYHLLGKPEEAYRCLKEMKRNGSVGERELALYLCTAGEQKVEAHNPKEAKKLFQRALKHDPKCATACYWLGNLEEELGNEKGSVEQWKKASTLSPELSAEALKSLERVMFHRGTFGDIERVYRDIVEARPWDEYATLALASFYRKQGRGEEAIEFLEEFRSMHPESIGSALLLTSLYAVHRTQDDLEKFLEDNEAAIAARSAHYVCADCGFQSTIMRWHCPRCNAFDSFSKKNEA
jgi:lipopolysaccharide biosynthesis regulator YciM